MVIASCAKGEASQRPTYLKFNINSTKVATQFILIVVQKHIQNDLIEGELGKGGSENMLQSKEKMEFGGLDLG